MHQTVPEPQIDEAAEELRIGILNRMSGVYVITNTVNGKRYVGSAVHIQKRISYHQWELRNARHHSVKLQRAWAKHGESAFEFKPLLICAQKDLLFYEQKVLDAFNCVEDGYNILPKAGSRLGLKHSAETRANMSAKHTGKTMSVEARAKMSARMIGTKQSPEAKKKIGDTQRGKKMSPESVKKMIGRVVSAETRAKIAMTLSGHLVSDAARAKMSASHFARARSLASKDGAPS